MTPLRKKKGPSALHPDRTLWYTFPPPWWYIFTPTLTREPVEIPNGLQLRTKSVRLVPPEGLTEQSGSYYLELTDEERSKAIIEASRQNAALVEVHSHPASEWGTSFSSSDLLGFKEFVPHIWWRLNGKPYAAIVFGQLDFDALAWTKDPMEMERLEGIFISGKGLIIPTGKTYLLSRWRWW